MKKKMATPQEWKPKKFLGAALKAFAGFWMICRTTSTSTMGAIKLQAIFLAHRGTVGKAHSESINRLARAASEKNLVLEPSI